MVVRFATDLVFLMQVDASAFSVSAVGPIPAPSGPDSTKFVIRYSSVIV